MLPEPRSLLDGLGGLIKAGNSSIEKKAGKMVIKIQDPVFSAPFLKFAGPVITNLMRAYEEITKDMQKFEKKQEAEAPKTAGTISLKPWSNDNPYE